MVCNRNLTERDFCLSERINNLLFKQKVNTLIKFILLLNYNSNGLKVSRTDVLYFFRYFSLEDTFGVIDCVIDFHPEKALKCPVPTYFG